MFAAASEALSFHHGFAGGSTASESVKDDAVFTGRIAKQRLDQLDRLRILKYVAASEETFQIIRALS